MKLRKISVELKKNCVFQHRMLQYHKNGIKVRQKLILIHILNCTNSKNPISLNWNGLVLFIQLIFDKQSNLYILAYFKRTA